MDATKAVRIFISCQPSRPQTFMVTLASLKVYHLYACVTSSVVEKVSLDVRDHFRQEGGQNVHDIVGNGRLRHQLLLFVKELATKQPSVWWRAGVCL